MTSHPDRIQRSGLIPAVLILVLCWLALCSPWLVSGKIVPFDSKDQFYPALYFVSQSLRSGELPFWNPYIYGGYPTVSDPQSMMFSPLALALMVLVDQPSVRWFDFIEFFHLLIGGIGMLLLSIRFGYSPTAGLYGAAVFMFGGSAAGRLQHVPMIYAYGYLPWAVLLLDTALASRRLRWAIGFGVVAGVMAAHQNQVAYLSSLLLLGYVCHRASVSDSIPGFLVSRWRVLSVAGLTGLSVFAVPVYATLQFLPLSSRSQLQLNAAADNSLHPVSWITIWVQGFFDHADPAAYWGPGDLAATFLYAGALPALLVWRYGWSTGVLFDRRFRYFLAVGVTAWIYSLGLFTPFYGFVHDWLPGVSLYRRPSDASFLVNAVIALATAFLIDRLVADGLPKARVLLSAGGLVLVACLSGWSLLHAWRLSKLEGLARDFVMAGLWLGIAWVLLASLARSRSGGSRLWVARIGLVFLVSDLGVHNTGRRFNSEEPQVFEALEPSLQPGSVGRFVRDGLSGAGSGPYRAEFVFAGSLWSNAPMVLGIESSQGYNPLRYRLYERVAGAQEIHSSQRPFPPLLPGYDAPMLDLLGVRYIVSRRALSDIDLLVDESRFPLVLDGDTRVWENPGVLPRVSVATAVYLEPDFERAVERGEVVPIDYSSTVVLDRWPETLEGAPPPGDLIATLPGTGEATAGIEAYGNDRVEVRVSGNRDAILVLRDLYYPYWRVRVDGGERALLRADYLFRGVHVPPGTHEVEFRFEPFSVPAIRETIRRFFAAADDPVNRVPDVISVRPDRGSGEHGRFTFTFSDPEGYQDAVRQTFLINDKVDVSDGCYIYHDADGVQLTDDAGANWQGPVPLGAAASLENSQCRVDAGRSSASGDGEQLTVTLDVTFFPSFEGIHSVWAYAEDGTGDSDFAEVGTWAVWTESPAIWDRIRLLLRVPGRRSPRSR